MRSDSKDFIFVYITTKDLDEAKRIGQTLIKEKLAACVNILPEMQSIYWWQGKIEKSNEAVLIVKTKASLYNKASAKIKNLHSYSCPCILALPIVDGNAEYLRWINKQS